MLVGHLEQARCSLRQRPPLLQEASHRESLPFELASWVEAQHDPKAFSIQKILRRCAPVTSLRDRQNGRNGYRRVHKPASVP